MLRLEGTSAGATLEERFARVQDDALRNYLRSRLVGVVEVRHTLVLKRPGTTGSSPRNGIMLHANAGVQDDMRCGGLTMVSAPHESVLSHIYGMSGNMVLNRRQVSVVDLAESTRVAGRMGVGYFPTGVQAENIVLSNLSNASHGLRGLSDLWLGAMITFIARDGILRTASLHVIARALPYANGQKLIEQQFDHTLAASYADAAKGSCGVTTIVRTAGEVYPGDAALIWLPD